MPHIRLRRLLAEERRPRGGGSPLPQRNFAEHGAQIQARLAEFSETARRRREARPPDLPALPIGAAMEVDVAVPGGKPVISAAQVPKTWGVEVIEERQDGVLLAYTTDLAAPKLARAAESFRDQVRTPRGRLRHAATRVAAVEQVGAIERAERMGEELASTGDIRQAENYLVDIELAAGLSQGEVGEERRHDFTRYLREAGGLLVGSIAEEDYALFRARISGRVVLDLLDNHPFVLLIDLPPTIEREGLALLDIDEPQLPELELSPGPPVGVIDGGMIPEQPLIRAAVDGPTHLNYLPVPNSILDGGADGHATAVISIAALGSLRQKLLRPEVPGTCLPVALARVLDDQTRLPDTVQMKATVPQIARDMRVLNGTRILNHSICSRAPFPRQRMSVWAEAIDRAAYDGGGEGSLFILAAGNIDGYVPSLNQFEQLIRDAGHPACLGDERCRLRNPAQAINALTVGAYVPEAATLFRTRQLLNREPIARTLEPSPVTRSGFGYLGEIKPEVVEEGGNFYTDPSRTVFTNPQATDVAVANSQSATDGRLIRFMNGTSVATPKTTHLGGLIERTITDASVDLIRALIVNSAEWPLELASRELTLRLFGYGVPRPERALEPGGARCLIALEDTIRIGDANYYRIPFPTDLFERNPETIIRVSITLAYRAPVRKTNRVYRGTVVQWRLSRRGESLDHLRRRCSSFTGDADEIPDPPVGDWNWEIGSQRRKKGTCQKDWFDAPAAYFGDELFLAVIGSRGWLSGDQQRAGFEQSFAAAVTIEATGTAIPIHEAIEARVEVPLPVPA